MRIALVNDLALAVEALRRTVATLPGATVAWIARDGQEAVDRAAADPPDLILMDMVMPVMDGVEATRRILARAPVPILVVTASVRGNQDRVYKALGAGAIDVAATPRLAASGEVLAAEGLIRKIMAAGTLTALAPSVGGNGAVSAAATSGTEAATSGAASAALRRSTSIGAPDAAPLLAIGASTGGPQALVEVLRRLPRPLRHAVVIAQHVDPQFAPGLATWLTSESGHPVRALRDGERPVAGDILLATSGDHVVLSADGALRYQAEPRQMPYRPSVDVLFHSLASHHGTPSVAVLLTGMGRDGAEGLLALRKRGWTTIAQDRKTSVVWGMPGAAATLGAATLVLPLTSIATSAGSAMHAAMRRSGEAPSASRPRQSPR